MIRIIIAEDQALVSGALAALLGLEDDLEVIALAKNGQEALALCEKEQPDILVTDIEMPLMTGLELAAAIAEKKLNSKVIVLTTFARSGYLRRAMASGVRGYMLKDAPADTLAAAIRTVHGGGRAIAPELAMESWGGEQDPLSERERQVLRLAGSGSSSTEIARIMHLSEGTVRNYLSEAISKLHAKNRVDAYRLARDQGWL
ncbi:MULTISPECIES: response regulator transcription factor [unclassified Undibacterium]|jgi:two-component system response regulator DesR|uniref:response regulator transcription factor n=1 Tax=unclassified Undibacterium TaxID=2630295 RepID=UPI001331CDAE|nr:MULTISPECIES: response regulator transcription factor [unclassified Undibacterium]BBB59755.1 DNA-binding response regulator [Undibacterium sp. KW1]BBB65728.1 DNA-binding response regulator [Undibacterium sp. YM2]